MPSIFHRLLLAVWLLSAAPAFCGAARFRMQASPEVLENARMQYRAAAMIADFAEGKKAFPETGGLVRVTRKDTFAAANGIPAGSMLLQRGGYDFSGDRKAFDPAIKSRKTAGGEVVWVTPDNMQHTMRIGSELLGVNYEEQRNLAFWYLRHGQRNAKWDSYVVTALLSQGFDAGISESCWAAACGEGYKPDPLLNWCGVFLAIERGDMASAEAHAAAYGKLRRPIRQEDFPLLPCDWVELAHQTGNMQHALEAGKAFLPYEYDEADGRLLVDLAAKAPKAAVSPVKLADGMKRRSFLTEMSTDEAPRWVERIAFAPLLEKATAAAKAKAAEFEPETLSRGADYFGTVWLKPAPAAADVELQIEFRLTPKDVSRGETADFNRAFVFGLVDAETTSGAVSMVPKSARLLLTEVNFGNGGMGNTPSWCIYAPCVSEKFGDQVWNSYLPVQKDLTTNSRPGFRTDGDTWHTLRIVRVKGWAEAVVDGKRVALTPVPMELDRPAMFLRVIGCDVTVKSLHADILE